MQEQKKYARIRGFLPILIFIGLAVVIQNWGQISLAFSPIDTQNVKAGDVVLYSTQWCPYCTKTRDFLETAKIPYTEYDIEKSSYAYQEYEELSGRGVPVLRIGDRTIEGHSPGKIRTAIAMLSEPTIL